MPIPEVSKIWMDGELIDWKNARIHILTHALHYGSGVFEGIRCYKTDRGPAVFRLREHMQRLCRSAKLYRMKLPYSVDELMKATGEVIEANNLEECYIRPIAYRGYGEMGLNPLKAPVNVSIAVWPWGTYLGEEGLENGITATISSFRRIQPNAIPVSAKATGQYINSILAKIEALDSGFDEAVMLDFRGFLSEGPGENLFMVMDDILYTTPEYASILPGITRDSVITLAADLGFEVRETDLTRDMLYMADEAFFTGTAAELTPIREVDGWMIEKPWPVTKKLQKVFFNTVKGNEEKYDEWLDYI
ncbi:MAG: branched chain amino acid aminotransferase [Candidatus Altiarchaeales archaeon ex4484_2]|nr:MAG: branched chain amino acid aminotransferase [Candidatus Altiarchaeales archaeon ex4484_2]